MPVLNFIGGPAYGLSKTGSTISIVEGGASSLNLAPNVIEGIVLSASNGDTTHKTYDISNLSPVLITPTSNQVILPSTSITQAQYESFAGAEVIGYQQFHGRLVLKALGDLPTEDIPISIMVLPF